MVFALACSLPQIRVERREGSFIIDNCVVSSWSRCQYSHSQGGRTEHYYWGLKGHYQRSAQRPTIRKEAHESAKDSIHCLRYRKPHSDHRERRTTRQTFDVSSSSTSKLSLSYRRSLVFYNMLIQASNNGTFHNLPLATGWKGLWLDTRHRPLHKPIARNRTAIARRTCVVLACFTPTWRRCCFLPWLYPEKIADHVRAIERRTKQGHRLHLLGSGISGSASSITSSCSWRSTRAKSPLSPDTVVGTTLFDFPLNSPDSCRVVLSPISCARYRHDTSQGGFRARNTMKYDTILAYANAHAI